MKWVILGLLAFSSLAQANEPHGGDAVLCQAANGTEKVETFDYFEASQYGLQIDLGAAQLNEREKAKVALRRLEFLDPEAYRYYGIWIDSFFREAVFANRSYIKEIDDTRELIEPRGNCYKIQFAVQIKNPADFEPRYLIDKYLWDRADSTQRAGLILHEVISRDALGGYYAADLEGVRYYNRVISSLQGDGMDIPTYARVLQRSHLGHGAIKRTLVLKE